MAFNEPEVPAFIYRKNVGNADNPKLCAYVPWAHEHWGGWEVHFFTVRMIYMQLIGGSTIVGRMSGKRYRSYQGEFGVQFPAFVVKKFVELIELFGGEPEKLAQFKPLIWNIGTIGLGIVAFTEEDAAVTAYNQGYRSREKDEPARQCTYWRSLLEYQKRQGAIA